MMICALNLSISEVPVMVVAGLQVLRSTQLHRSALICEMVSKGARVQKALQIVPNLPLPAGMRPVSTVLSTLQ